MNKKLTLKEYIESKKILKSATEHSLRVNTKYALMKYCKLPLVEEYDSEDKEYVALKPKDIIEVLWEFDEDNTAIVKHIIILETNKKYFPSWNDRKMVDWVHTNTIRYIK